jgi:signal transduction histidine kinase
MNTPVYFKTIGFKLTIWYTAMFIILGIMLIVSINLAMRQARRDVPRLFMGGNQQPAEVAVIVGDKYLDYLRFYSLISFCGVVILGGVGGYLLSKRTLKAVDNITTLATRISTTNLKERIGYQGPDDEMKRLADTFDNMLIRLENAFESQNQFIQDAAHELRTPIAIAKTNIDVLEMEKKPTSKDYKHLIEVLKLSIERMSKLSDKLLLLSKEDQKPPKSSIVNIAPLIDELVAEFSANAKNNEVVLQIEKMPNELLVRGDALHLKQAISNVIDNAIRYNRPGGKVNIATKVDDNQLVIQIKDTGIGISRAEQKLIFDRFYRVDKSRSRAQGGSGLGLAIVRKIIEDHGGSITVDSTPDAGSTFKIKLPISK